MNKTEIELGDEVKDNVTGFAGMCVGITHWLNGCVRIVVQPRKLDKDGKICEPQSIDAEQLVITKKVKPTTALPKGGPQPDVARRADAKR